MNRVFIIKRRKKMNRDDDNQEINDHLNSMFNDQELKYDFKPTIYINVGSSFDIYTIIHGIRKKLEKDLKNDKFSIDFTSGEENVIFLNSSIYEELNGKKKIDKFFSRQHLTNKPVMEIYSLQDIKNFVHFIISAADKMLLTKKIMTDHGEKVVKSFNGTEWLDGTGFNYYDNDGKIIQGEKRKLYDQLIQI